MQPTISHRFSTPKKAAENICIAKRAITIIYGMSNSTFSVWNIKHFTSIHPLWKRTNGLLPATSHFHWRFLRKANIRANGRTWLGLGVSLWSNNVIHVSPGSTLFIHTTRSCSAFKHTNYKVGSVIETACNFPARPSMNPLAALLSPQRTFYFME